MKAPILDIRDSTDLSRPRTEAHCNIEMQLQSEICDVEEDQHQKWSSNPPKVGRGRGLLTSVTLRLRILGLRHQVSTIDTSGRRRNDHRDHAMMVVEQRRKSASHRWERDSRISFCVFSNLFALIVV